MSYEHPILVPGATGHDDVAALRAVVEDIASQCAIAGIKEQLEEPQLDINEIQERLKALAEGIEDMMDLLT